MERNFLRLLETLQLIPATGATLCGDLMHLAQPTSHVVLVAVGSRDQKNFTTRSCRQLDQPRPMPGKPLMASTLHPLNPLVLKAFRVPGIVSAESF